MIDAKRDGHEVAMSETPFHATPMGREFFEKTVPQLLRRLAELNEVLGRIAEALERPKD